MNKLIIRHANKKDINSILKIGNSHEDFQVSKKIHFYRKDELKQWIRDKKNNIFLVVLVDSKIIGFTYCKIISKDWAMVDNFFIIPEFRKKGIGSRIESFLERELKKRKIDYFVFLVKHEKKPFRRFLRKHGFKEHSKYIWIDKFL